MKRHPLALAVSAGLAIASPSVVLANCPAPVSDVISISTGTTVVVNASGSIPVSGCTLGANDSIVVESGGVIDVNYTGDNFANGIATEPGSVLGGISISGEISVDSPNGATGVSLNNNDLSSDFNVAGNVLVTGGGTGTVRGLWLSRAELPSPLTISGTVRASGNLNDSTAVYIAAQSFSEVPNLTVSPTGRVESVGPAIYMTADFQDGGDWLNEGQIRAPEGASTGGGIWLDAAIYLGRLTNTNLIEGRGTTGSQPEQRQYHGLYIQEASGIGDLTNSGTITSISGGDGIHVTSKYGAEYLYNDIGATISAVNQGSGIYTEGEFGPTTNLGNIRGAEHGISIAESGSWAVLANFGEVSGGTGYDIYIADRDPSGFPAMQVLISAQSGLTYRGLLPGQYVMVVTDSGRFGQMEVTDGVGQMSFSVASFSEPSNMVPPAGSFEELSAPAVPMSNLMNNRLYPRVLSGVSESMLLNTTGNVGGFDWELVPGSGTHVWDLCVGDCSSVPVPVMGPWSLLALGGLSGLMGLWGIRRRQQRL